MFGCNAALRRAAARSGVALFMAAMSFCALSPSRASLTPVYSFGSTTGGATGPVVLGTDGLLYGATWELSNCGYVYRVNADGTGFRILHQFSGTDGSAPFGALIEGFDGNLYGVTQAGGNGWQPGSTESGYGVVYQLARNGKSFAVIHTFSGTDGAAPLGGLQQDVQGTLLGVTSLGGPSWTSTGPNYGYGVAYAMNMDGTGFAVTHSFTGSDGDHPTGLVLASDGTLYGSTSEGGPGFNVSNLLTGLVFHMGVDGSAYSIIRVFNSANGGLAPTLMLQDLDGSLVGSMDKPQVKGAPVSQGSIFSIPTDGSELTILHSFRGPDGSEIEGLTIGSDGRLYGSTFQGGPNAVDPSDGLPLQGGGTLFDFNLNRTKFDLIAAFDPQFDSNGAPSFGPLGSGPNGAPAVTERDTLFIPSAAAGSLGYGTIDHGIPGLPIPYVVNTVPAQAIGDATQKLDLIGGCFDRKAQVQINGVTVASTWLSLIELKLSLTPADLPNGDVYTVTVSNPGQPQGSNPWSLIVPSRLTLGKAVLTSEGGGVVSVKIPISTSETYPAANVSITRITLTLPFVAKATSISPTTIALIEPGKPATVTATFDTAGYKSQQWILAVTVMHSGGLKTLTETVNAP